MSTGAFCVHLSDEVNEENQLNETGILDNLFRFARMVPVDPHGGINIDLANPSINDVFTDVEDKEGAPLSN